MLDEADPIWGAMPAQVEDWADGGRDVHCARSGGHYQVSGTALGMLKQLSAEAKARLTTWIVDRNRFAGDVPPVIDSDLLQKRLPTLPAMSAGQQMERLLLYLSSRSLRPGHKIAWLGPHQQTPETEQARQAALAWIEAHSESELAGVRMMLESAGLLANDNNRIHVTATGFARLDELRRGAIASDQVFVAMWFDAQMGGIYEEAIEPAIQATGFRALRIDRKEHNNKIDDEIIAEIRRSRFVIADFTCGEIMAEGEPVCIPRGGVYYEAGFAQGLGIPVIWSVRADQIDDVHFDTRQFNHIAWTDAVDLKTRLINRIRAMFVEAP